MPKKPLRHVCVRLYLLSCNEYITDEVNYPIEIYI